MQSSVKYHFIRTSLSSLNRALLGSKFANAKYFLLVDKNTYRHCLPMVLEKVSAFSDAVFFEVPAGEKCKDIKIATQLWNQLLESGADRNAVIVNIGGGSLMDLGGFVAAGYKRGIRYINIPTTFLGMVDASIGGKTAVNVGGVKNQVGFIHHPAYTCLVPKFMNTLKPRDVVNGGFEYFKTMLVADPDAHNLMLEEIKEDGFSIPQEHLISCVHNKFVVCKQDPHDLSARHILNFGHTFGHAIESFGIKHKSPLMHGEAVAAGMICALYLSTRKLGLSEQVYQDYRARFEWLMPMPKYSLADTEELLSYMRSDKKNADGNILAVLLKEPGAPVIDVALSEPEIRDAFLQL